MALPFRIDALERQVILFNPGQPPFLPQINTFPEIQHLLPQIASAVANEVSQKCGGNVARIFVYNMLSFNNWANNDFIECVDLAANMVAFNFLKRGSYRSPEMALQDSITNAVTLFVSRKIFIYRELMGYCQPELQNAAQQNIQMYINLDNEIQQLRNFPQQTQFVQGGYPQQQFVPQGFPVQQQPIYHRGQPPQQPQNFGGTTLGNPTPSPVDQGRFYNRHKQSNFKAATPEPVQQSVQLQTPVEVPVTKADWKPSAHQPYRALYDDGKYIKTYTRQNGIVVELFEPKQEQDMDRAKHTIKLLGNTYSLDSVLRQERIGEHVDILNTITPKDLRALIGGKEETDSGIKISEFITSEWYVNLFLEAAIFDGRCMQKKNQPQNTGSNVYRCYATVAKPVITMENYKYILEKLNGARTFTELANRLKEIGPQAEQNASSDESLRSALDDMMMFCNEIDLHLTALINDFLKNKLSLGDVCIDSFTDDISGLSKYLEKNYGLMYSSAYDKFEFGTLPSVLQPIGDDAEVTLADQLSVEVINSYIPINYSFTYLDILDHELNIQIKPGESLLIKEEMSPLLYNVADSLFNQGMSKDLLPVYDLLVTQDNRIYQLHRGYLGTRSYLISNFCC